MSKHYFNAGCSSISEAIEPWKDNFSRDYCSMIQKIIWSDPFDGRKFYIHQVVKNMNSQQGLKKMIHHARLTKPEPTPGSTLLRADPRDPETVTILWTLPEEEAFGLFQQGKACADPFVYECIQKYLHDSKALMCKEEGDISDREIQEIYRNKRSRNRNV